VKNSLEDGSLGRYVSRFPIMVILLLSIAIIPCKSYAENTSEELEITWENSGEITFVVPSNQMFQFGIGITSASVNEQIINLEIVGETTWGVEENVSFTIDYNDTIFLPGEGDAFMLHPGNFANITVGVLIPPVINGYPPAETAYPFQLKLSNSTGAFSTWNYSVSILPKYSIAIDEIIEYSEINPSGTVTHQIEIRNTGNIYTQFESEISPLDEEGNIILTNESNRFEKSGWNATLSGWIGAMSLAPNESNIFKITVNAPYSPSGNLSILVHIRSIQGGLIEDIYLNSSILIKKDAHLQFTNNECEDFVTEKKCVLNLKIQNTGNYIDIIHETNCTTSSDFIGFNTINSIFENNAPNFIKITEYNQDIILEPNDIFEIEFEIIFQPSALGVNAGTIGTVICNYHSDELNISDTSELEITIADFHNIEYDLNPNSWTEGNKLYLSLEIENKGNIPESFAISISVSHDGNHSLLLPLNAIYDENSSRIRSYELLDIQPFEGFNITGWMYLPESAVEDQLVSISIDATTHSSSFTKTWKKEITIKGKGTDEISENTTQEQILFYKLRNSFNAHGYSIIAIIIATIMIYQALKIRSQRNTQKNKGITQNNKEWMSTFFVKKKNKENLDSPSISKAEFKQMFSEKGGDKQIPIIPLQEKGILKNASDTIDKSDKKQSEEELDLLVEDLLDDMNIKDSEFDY
jgi:hypothetical protein